MVPISGSSTGMSDRQNEDLPVNREEHNIGIPIHGESLNALIVLPDGCNSGMVGTRLMTFASSTLNLRAASRDRSAYQSWAAVASFSASSRNSTGLAGKARFQYGECFIRGYRFGCSRVNSCQTASDLVTPGIAPFVRRSVGSSSSATLSNSWTAISALSSGESDKASARTEFFPMTTSYPISHGFRFGFS